MLRLLVATSCVFAAAGAVAEPLRLSSATLKELLTGALIEFDTPLHTTMPVRFTKDGLVSGKAGVLASVLGAERDRGRWWVENDQLCVKWFRWFEAKRRCVVVHQEGDRLFWRGEDRSGTASVVEHAAKPQVASAAPKEMPETQPPAPAPARAIEPEAIAAPQAPVTGARQAPVPTEEPADEPSRMTFATAGAAGSVPFHLFPSAVAAPASAQPEPTASAAPAPAAPDSMAAASLGMPPETPAPAAKPAEVERKMAVRRAPKTAASSLVMRTSFRVAGVDADDILNVRSGPSETAAPVGAIPPEGRGVKIVGPCREAWCPIEHGRTRGWVNRYYLAAEDAGSTAAP